MMTRYEAQREKSQLAVLSLSSFQSKFSNEVYEPESSCQSVSGDSGQTIDMTLKEGEGEVTVKEEEVHCDNQFDDNIIDNERYLNSKLDILGN